MVQYIVTTKRPYDGTLVFGPDLRPIDRPKEVQAIMRSGVATAFVIALSPEYESSQTRSEKEFNSWLRAIAAAVSN